MAIDTTPANTPERKLVNDFLKYIDPASAFSYLYVDRDSPERQFRSGWDFLLTRKGRTVFFEAKLLRSTRKNAPALWPDTEEAVLKLLTDYQEYTRGRVLFAESPYAILIFNPGERPRVYVSTSVTDSIREYDAIEYVESLIGERPFLSARRVMRKEERPA